MTFPLTSHPHLVHGVFEALAISSGVFFYRYRLGQSGVGTAELLRGSRFAVLLGCIFGAAIGNKLVFWLEVPQFIPVYWNSLEVWFAGQSIVGGLIGGLIGVEFAKKLHGVTSSTGDAFVFPILLGICIGRIGCFVAGLDDGTYGLPASLPWAVDFGDGMPRHPTQLYEILFALILWVLLYRMRPRLQAYPGLMFRLMLISYLVWRLFVDGLKPNPYDYGLGLSGIQVTCMLALLVYIPLSARQLRRSLKPA